ncbi:type IV toxin-antitoxin system AbiEi family antitoxin [Bacteroidota bacterium]
MTKKSTYNYIDSYLTEVLSIGRYSVTLDELKTKFEVSEKAILQNIYRLKQKNQLAQVRKEFYVIIPPQYSKRGMLPVTLFIEDMMEFLKREYYVGLYSAAALHGAGHQQPMEFQVMTKKPALRNIKNDKLSIVFFTKSQWEQDFIIEKKTDAGFINVSTPELTAFDLIYYHKKIGGLNRILPIFEDLTESINSTSLVKTARFHKITTIQRLGYILEELGSESFSNALFRKIEHKLVNEIPLSLAHKNRLGEVNKKWNIIINISLDF